MSFRNFIVIRLQINVDRETLTIILYLFNCHVHVKDTFTFSLFFLNSISGDSIAEYSKSNSSSLLVSAAQIEHLLGPFRSLHDSRSL